MQHGLRRRLLPRVAGRNSSWVKADLGRAPAIEAHVHRVPSQLHCRIYGSLH